MSGVGTWRYSTARPVRNYLTLGFNTPITQSGPVCDHQPLSWDCSPTTLELRLAVSAQQALGRSPDWRAVAAVSSDC